MAADSFSFPPARSISLPTKLKQTSPTVESEAEPVQITLLRLTKSYNSTNSLVLSPVLTSHTLIPHHHCRETVNKALDESVALLDACSLGKDLTHTMRAKVQLLQSALRRRGAESSIRSHLASYFHFRRHSSKDISRSIRALTKQIRDSSVYTSMITQEACFIILNVLRYFILLSSSPLMKFKLGDYLSTSKTVSMSFFSSQKGNKQEMNEAGCVDLALYSIYQQAKKGNDFRDEAQMVQKKLESLGIFMDGLEDGLHGMYKFLIQYRVSLLNSLTH